MGDVESGSGRPSISQSEMTVLRALWAHGPMTVRQCLEYLADRDWAYTTVQTLLTRMEAKGLVACDRGGQAHVFRAAESRESLLRGRLRDLADQLCDGMASPLVLALMDDPKLSAAEIAALRQRLDRIEAGHTSTDGREARSQ